jgi:hypothetical protein
VPLNRAAPAGVQFEATAADQPPAIARWWPSQNHPQQAEAQLPLRRERRLTGSVRTAAASGQAGGQGRPPVRLLNAGCRRWHPLTRNGLVWRVLSTDFPPVWTVYWAAKWQSGDTPGPCMTSRVYLPGQGRADRPDHRFPACMPDGHRMLAADASNWLLPRAKISLEWPFCHFYGPVRSWVAAARRGVSQSSPSRRPLPACRM